MILITVLTLQQIKHQQNIRNTVLLHSLKNIYNKGDLLMNYTTTKMMFTN